MEQRLPAWFRQRIPNAGEMSEVPNLLRELSLSTVCQSARCPNAPQCYARRTATFMILGETCTRGCTFCAVSRGKPGPVDPAEPGRLAEAIARLGLRYVVITSVTRDDLPDGGAGHFARTIETVRRQQPGIKIEALVPDFGGQAEALATVLAARPEVLGHNLETVPRLYPEVRPQADYRRSLDLLRNSKRRGQAALTKSGLMLGLGETEDEVIKVLQDLRGAGCDILTLGQYLAPSRGHHAVADYVPPPVFEAYRERALALGFRAVAAAPQVRSSYRAEELFTDADAGLGDGKLPR